MSLVVRDDDNLFAGRYELVDVLGPNGSGVIRRAHDRVLDRPVAIKLLRTSADDDAFRARLRGEARLAGSLHHPGIAQVYDYGEVEVRDEPTPYVVMQYVEGTALRQLFREHRALTASEVMELVTQVADALVAAHAAGVVRCELTSANILVTEAGRAVLVDVGLGGTSAAGTSVSDVHSLGLLAAEGLASVTDVPPAVADLVREMTAERPEDRPDATEVADRARALTGGPAPSSSSRILPPPPADANWTPVWRRDALRSRRIQAASALVVVALIGAVLVAARPATTRVPGVEGLTWSEARRVLADRELAVERRDVDLPGVQRGTVLSQDPGKGASTADDTVVLVEVASGTSLLDPDEVVGRSYEEAARVLVRLGLVPVRNDVPRPGGDGTVVTALPAGRLATGTTVTLTVGVPER